MPAVVTYCRVSSEEQAEKDISIPAQRKALLRWVADQPALRMAAEFVDEGISAYAPADKRPGFCEMVSFCRKNDVQFILVHKLDRFSRNREESILFKSLLRKHGVQVKSVTENYDPETPQGFLYEGMIEVINQFYSMNLATETMKGMRENAERGWHNGGRTPYGYLLERVDEKGRERGRLVPGPEEHVAIVREMFDLSVHHGYGGRRIANLLNGRKVPAPTRTHWNASTVNNILENPVYAGDIVWMKSQKAGRTGRVATAEDERIIHRDAHEAIVDRTTWERRQELSTQRQFVVHKSTRKSVDYLLSRLIRCEHCGSNFIGRRHTYKAQDGRSVTQLSYYCSGYLYKGRSVCPSLPVDAAWVEGFVLDIIQARLCEKEAWEDLEARLRARIDGRRRKYGQDPKAAEARLADVDRKIHNYYAAIGAGLDPLVCKARVEELRVQREQVEAEAVVLRKEDYYTAALEKNLGALHRFRAAFRDGFARLPFGLRREIVLHFIDNIVVHDRRELRVLFQVPFDGMGVEHLCDEAEGQNGRRPAGEAGLRGLPDFFPSGAEWLRLLDLNQRPSG